MIDQQQHTNRGAESALRRLNRRRYASQRMLQATDRVLWQLEEMNRDGVKTCPRPAKRARDAVEHMPNHIRGPCRHRPRPGHLAASFEVAGATLPLALPEWDDTSPRLRLAS